MNSDTNYKGSISKKRINGREYYYHQWSEDGKRRSRTVSEKEAYDISFSVEHGPDSAEIFAHRYKTKILFGGDLYESCRTVTGFKERYQISELLEYLDKPSSGKVMVLYGLRRTGKTTLIFQSLLHLDVKEFSKAAYIHINENSFDDLDEDLSFLKAHGFRYIYIDEVTLLSDFVNRASVLSDIYALQCRIVLSGTDSLGFMIAGQNELYNRSQMLHTTYISYKEFSEVLDIRGIDSYIEFGGTMTMEGRNYNAIFADGKSASEYVDSAIAHNIEHSLALYKDGSHFASLYDLYRNNELVNVINRVVEDRNHRFVREIIEQDFKSHDYGSLKDLLSKNADESIRTVLRDVDEALLLRHLKSALDIIDKDQQTVPVTDVQMLEVQEYLNILDMCSSIDEVNMVSGAVTKHTVFTQPGIRFCQAKELIKALFLQEPLRILPLPVQDLIKDKLISDVMGRMLEEIVLYQSSLKGECFKLMFPIGEYDMVRLFREERCADIFEIKYSSIVEDQQYRFLIDTEKQDRFEARYYSIRNKYVLYRGENRKVGDIQYLNVEEYLMRL